MKVLNSFYSIFLRKHEKQLRGTGTGRQFVLTARTKTIERTGTGRQLPPSLASLSATKNTLVRFSERTLLERFSFFLVFLTYPKGFQY